MGTWLPQLPLLCKTKVWFLTWGNIASLDSYLFIYLFKSVNCTGPHWGFPLRQKSIQKMERAYFPRGTARWIVKCEGGERESSCRAHWILTCVPGRVCCRNCCIRMAETVSNLRSSCIWFSACVNSFVYRWSSQSWRKVRPVIPLQGDRQKDGSYFTRKLWDMCELNCLQKEIVKQMYIYIYDCQCLKKEKTETLREVKDKT